MSASTLSFWPKLVATQNFGIIFSAKRNIRGTGQPSRNWWRKENVGWPFNRVEVAEDGSLLVWTSTREPILEVMIEGDGGQPRFPGAPPLPLPRFAQSPSILPRLAPAASPGSRPPLLVPRRGCPPPPPNSVLSSRYPRGGSPGEDIIIVI
jgi:hypothetical protein